MFEYIDWVLAVLDPPAPGEFDWIACAVWGMHGTHYVSRRETRARILALVDPDAIPPGLLTFWWLNDHATVAMGGGEPLAPYLEPMRDTAWTID